jgi:cytosine/creatinine deaminase
MADLLITDARVVDNGRVHAVDIAIDAGIIVGMAGNLGSGAREMDAGGLLVVPGLVDTHLHLDKSRLTDRIEGQPGTLQEAMAWTKKAKAEFSIEDIFTRAEETLRRCITHGTTRIRTQVEVDPVIGLRGLEAINALAQEYARAVTIQICVYPQDGLLYPSGVDLLARALEQGGNLIGGAPYADDNPVKQIDALFSLAQTFDVDIDMHLDFAEGTEDMQVEYVCRKTDECDYGGRVTLGHLTQLSYVPPERYARICDRLASAGVAVTVLPSTDLFLMGRTTTHARYRGVLPVAGLLERGVPCSIATNNVLNAFTPYGDGSLIRIANLYANICHLSGAPDLADCLGLITDRAAQVIGVNDYGIAVGNPADLVLLDVADPASAVAENASALWGMKAGRQTFTRARPQVVDLK